MSALEVAVAAVAAGGAGALILGLALYLRARRLLAAGQESLAEAERTEQSARAAEHHAGEQLAQATGARDEARRIEEALIRPRWALNLKSGRIRALLHDERADLLVEVEVDEPDPSCRDCAGRGWHGRDRQTQKVVPCACVKRALHSARQAARG